ncbi:XRE family transcriptional regulator [Burkholderia glumae]|uniref:helix-turn-helix domain-containing protein n=1 Tax=Burkholderia glumae TaxID=337 RepID=UPI000F5EDAA9|nr:helix-turn-helix transcriptional regulator [Burkholderia glumae]RQZ65534.1 XRE family transcriptional regulator [Burkholderia glumae]
MSRRDWKKVVPTSLPEAMRLTKDFARERRNLSVERIADLMGVTPDALYKWLGTGRIPAPLILVYENVCGINFVSRYLASSTGNLVIPIPTGRTVEPIDVQGLQTVLNDAVGAILDFAARKKKADETLSAIQAGMCALAWHHGNVDRTSQPDLEFTCNE